MSFPFRKTLLATALAVASSGAFAGALLNDGLDGAWGVPGDPGASNRGAMFDVLAREDGSADVFGSLYTYDANGAPLWLNFAANFLPGESAKDGIEVYRYHGGSFGYPAMPATEEVIGTASISLNGPDSISLSLTMTGLPNVVLDMAPAHRLFPGYIASASTAAASLSACPAGTTAQGNDCLLPNSIASDLILPAGKAYLIRGEVSVNAGGTLTIEPGVTVKGHADTSTLNYLVVRKGGRIYAEGTATRPIVFTGPEPVIGSWGGVSIAGNSTCNRDPADCKFEANPEITYGGNDLHDNSGILRYVRIEYAGIAISQDSEFNSLTLLGVGDGTIIDHVQVDSGKDDGFEWFGGSVNGTHLVCSNMGDDCFDMDQGFSGKLQFLLGWQGDNTDIGSDSNGIESDNWKEAPDTLPRTQPQISNITLVGAEGGRDGIRIRRGSGGNYANLVVTGYQSYSIGLDDDATFALPTQTLSFAHSFFGASGSGIARSNTESWFTALGVETGDPKLDGFLPQSDSPILNGGKSLSNPFFRPTTYRGAFAGKHDDWTAGWTVRLPR